MTLSSATSLKLGGIAYTLLWTCWMIWWSGSYSRATVIILSMCGSIAGYLWYRAMRWRLERTDKR